jgi:hypothetical protein
MKVNKLTNNGKTESETSMYSRGARVCLPEAIEDIRKKLFADPYA